MNFLSLVCTIFIINKYYIGDCAVIQTPEKTQEYGEEIKREESLLATGVSDKTRNRNSYDQSKPKYLDVISEDHGQPLDNLVESQDGSLEQTIKEKRCKTGDNFVGLSRNPNINLPLIRRDTASTFFKRSCDNCMSGPMCKTKGKCESCKKVCEKYEASLDQQAQDTQSEEPITEQNSDNKEKVGISSRLSSSNEDQGGLSYGDDRYYTVGSFEPGPIHKLLAKMLNIKSSDCLEQLVVLAKTKTKKIVNSIHPVVIDTAHVFTLNKGGPSKLDVELHKVSDAATNAEAIASELDKEFDKALEEKRSKSGSSYLAPKEIDDIIEETMGKNFKKSENQNGNKLEQNKNETVACKDEDKDGDEEEFFVPYKPMLRENNAENETSHQEKILEEQAASKNKINDSKTNITNRLYLPDSQEQVQKENSQSKSGKLDGDSKKLSSRTELKGVTEFIEPSNESNTRKNSNDSLPKVGQQPPHRPFSESTTTTIEPTTVHKGPKPPLSKSKKKKENEKGEGKETEITPSQESLHERTTPAVDHIETTRHFGFPHGPKEGDASNDKSEKLRQQPPMISKEINTQEQWPKSSSTDENIMDSTLEKKMYEDKYNKLKQWVMENVGAEPPASEENSQNHVGESIKGIIDSATKINNEISDIVQHNTKDPNLLKMVRENNEKLKNIDDNKKLYSITLPNMNEFRTRLSPEDEHKINEVFESSKPKQRMNKDPYNTHPRKISQYRNGEWVYEKTNPNKPPYATKHRASQPSKYDEYKDHESVMENTPFVDSQLMDMDKVAKSLKEMPETLSDKNNKVVSIIGPDNLKNPLNASRYHAEKRLEQETDNESSQLRRVDSSEPKTNEETQTERKDFNVQNTIFSMQSVTEKAPVILDLKNNETVACSKEEEEEMKQILHFLPSSRSSEHQSKHNMPLLDNSLSEGKSSEHEDEHILDSKPKSPENTEDMIKSLNKMHKHSKTAHSEPVQDFENTNDESQRSFIQPNDSPPMEVGQYSFPPEQNQRYSMPIYSDQMRINSDLSPNEVDPNFIHQQMMFNGQSMVGSPYEQTFQEPHLGRFLPRHSKRALSLHTRDVSEQDKQKNMYFVGDGIKLPLNMKEHHDGSLHLSLDVKSLCNCKHCTARQLENNTIILEAVPISENDKQGKEIEIDGTTERIQEKNISTSDNETDSKEFDSSEEDQKTEPIQYEADKINISKRSLQTKNSLHGNEIRSDPPTSEEKIIPMVTLSKEEILKRLGKFEDRYKNPEESGEASNINITEDRKEIDSEKQANQKMRLFANVLDFMKKFALDV